MADLKLIISEQITLPNKNIETLLNTVTISDVNQIVRRVDTIATTFDGLGIEILRFVNSEEQQVAGSFVKDQVKYIRITNLSSIGSAEIYFISTGNESSIFQLDPKKSLMMNNAEFNASSTNDYLVENYVDETYYSGFVVYDTVKAKAISSSIQLEYLVASS